MTNIPARKFLCADALVSAVYHQFQKIPDPRELPQSAPISFIDVLMSGLAVFGLKFPSLLKYDLHRSVLDENLRNRYHINRPPSDTYLRERLDECVSSAIALSRFSKLYSLSGQLI